MYQMETCTINASSTTSEFVLMCKVLMCVIDTFLWRSVQTHRQHKHTPCQLDERGYIYIYIYIVFFFVIVGWEGVNQTGSLNGSWVRDPVAEDYSVISPCGWVFPCVLPNRMKGGSAKYRG